MPGQELLQPGSRVIIDPAEDIGEPGLRVDVVELGGLDQGEHRSGALAAPIRAGEEPSSAADGNRPVILPIWWRGPASNGW